MAVKFYSNYDKTTTFSDVSPVMTLTAGNELTYTVPGAATAQYQALFSYTSNGAVFVGLNVTAATPADNTVVAARNLEFKPIRRFVNGGDVLHFVSPDTRTYVGVSLRSLNAGS